MQASQTLLILLICSQVFSSSIIPLSQSRSLATQTTPRLLAATNPTQDREEMLHIEKLVDINNDYELTVSTSWQPYGDLKNTFDLSFSQYVGLNLRIAIYVRVPCKMKVRVVIDGAQNKIFRREIGQTKFIVMMANEFVWLAKGRHTVQVQYIKDGADQTIQFNRINMALFKLVYLNRKQPLKQTKTLFAETSFPISLTNTGWTPFPDLKINFKLESAQQVTISYKTMVAFDVGPNYFVTRVIIDNKQNDLFLYHTGLVSWPTNLGSYTVELQGGYHQVRVQYRTAGNVVKNTKQDWNRNFLIVKYRQ